jgi:dihydroxyacetone kinase-like predicted kinase
MSDAAKSVATGEVTQAVRDTNTDAGVVKNGDWIGLVRGDGVVAIGSTMVVAATQLLDQLLSGNGELLTVITGNLATARATEEIIAYMADKHPGVEVEVHPGGQPLYPFLFGVE